MDIYLSVDISSSLIPAPSRTQVCHTFHHQLLYFNLFQGLLSRALHVLHLALCLTLGVFQALVVHVNATDLSAAHAKDEEVDSSQSHVLGSDNEAPACPNGACAHESKVLGKGEGFGRPGEVGGTGEDHAPFHYRGPVNVC